MSNSRKDQERMCLLCSKSFLSIRGRKKCTKCYQKIRNKRLIDKIYEIVEEQCWVCGYTEGEKSRPCLEFHHMNRSQKIFSLYSRNIFRYSWEKVIEELKKCACLCALCHRRVEFDLISKEEIDSIYKNRWDLINKKYNNLLHVWKNEINEHSSY